MTNKPFLCHVEECICAHGIVASMATLGGRVGLWLQKCSYLGNLDLQSPLDVLGLCKKQCLAENKLLLRCLVIKPCSVFFWGLPYETPPRKTLFLKSACHFFNGYNCQLSEFVNYQLPDYQLSCLLVGCFGRRFVSQRPNFHVMFKDDVCWCKWGEFAKNKIKLASDVPIFHHHTTKGIDLRINANLAPSTQTTTFACKIDT